VPSIQNVDSGQNISDDDSPDWHQGISADTKPGPCNVVYGTPFWICDPLWIRKLRVKYSLETWIDNFKRDADPDSEIAIWERIARAYMS